MPSLLDSTSHSGSNALVPAAREQCSVNRTAFVAQATGRIAAAYDVARYRDRPYGREAPAARPSPVHAPPVAAVAADRAAA